MMLVSRRDKIIHVDNPLLIYYLYFSCSQELWRYFSSISYRPLGSLRHLLPHPQTDNTHLRRFEPSRQRHYVWRHHFPQIPWYAFKLAVGLSQNAFKNALPSVRVCPAAVIYDGAMLS